MSSKERAIDVIRKLSEEATMEEILEEISILAALEKGENDADAGRFVSQEEARKRMESWLSR